uniref:Superoxide dismutase n=1 Tax=Brachionus plicatilis TaxID=10195 RepID=A0A2L0HII7_BRAPC|nr:manganese superoxide dismutase [Brachionus plicatilis]
MSFQLPPLPYDYQVLEPFVDKETMNLHHTKHHQTYVNNLNGATKDSDIVAICQNIKNYPVAVRNNGGGHYNHSLFWKWMAPVGSSNVAPTGTLKEKIEATFGSVDEMKKKFTDAALTRFGSGWAWLGVQKDGSLAISSTANQDNPLMAGVADVEMIPILGLDVWEHAYYLKYQNRRAEYIQQWWNVVNWDEVVKYYDNFASKNNPVPINQ